MKLRLNRETQAELEQLVRDVAKEMRKNRQDEDRWLKLKAVSEATTELWMSMQRYLRNYGDVP